MAVIAVTGSASGIGAATCAALRESGHEIVGVDLHRADIVADLGSADGRRAAVDGILGRCSGTLDGLVACAGLGPHTDDPSRIISVNYFGTVAVIDGLFPALREGSNPAAAIVSSVASAHLTWRDNPIAAAADSNDEPGAAAAVESAGDYRGQLAYAASKNALTVAVRRRVAQWGAAGVRINTVAPGAVDTPLLLAGAADPRYAQAIRDFTAPIPRRAKPEEIATLISFLISPQASFVHGAQFVIDGGIDAVLRPTRF